MDKSEIEAIAKTAAHEAVREVLVAMGIEAYKPLDVQKDHAYLRTQRLAQEQIEAMKVGWGWKVGFRAISTIVTVALLGWLVARGFIQK